MICNNCGRKIDNNAKFCANCGNKIENINNISENNVDIKSKSLSENRKKNNALLGKKYKFKSMGGIHIFSMTFTRVHTCVTIEEDKLNIDVVPKNYSTASKAYFSEIIDIKVKSIIAKAYLIGTIISAIYALVSPIWLLSVILCIWLGYNKKIIICQKNKKDICIYTSSKNMVEELCNDVKSLISDNKSVRNNKNI